LIENIIAFLASFIIAVISTGGYFGVALLILHGTLL